MPMAEGTGQLSRLCMHPHLERGHVYMKTSSIETFSALLAPCAGNSPATDEFPSQRPVTRSFDVFLNLTSTNGLVNNREAGDLRLHHAHYDVTVMIHKYREGFAMIGN